MIFFYDNFKVKWYLKHQYENQTKNEFSSDADS